MNDIILRNEDEQSIGYRKSTRGLAEAVGALTKISAVDLLPPTLGGMVALGSTILVRKFGKSYPNLSRFAPFLGVASGIAASIPLYWWKGPKAVIAGSVASFVVGGGLFLYEWVSTRPWALSGMYYASRDRVRGVHTVEGGGGYALPTAQVPGPVSSALDVTAFGTTPT